MAKDAVKAINLFSIDATTVNGTFQLISNNPIPVATFFLRITNSSNQDMSISFDGINDNDFVLSRNYIDIPMQTNNQPNGHIALLPAQTFVWVRGTTAASGRVIVSGYYQDQ